MTKEEKAELELQRAHAEVRCKEVYRTIGQIKGILSDYFKDYHRWRKRFEDADRTLAMSEKLTILPGSGKRKDIKKELDLTVKLTKKQILEIAEVLGVEVELNFDEDENEKDELLQEYEDEEEKGD